MCKSIIYTFFLYVKFSRNNSISCFRLVNIKYTQPIIILYTNIRIVNININFFLLIFKLEHVIKGLLRLLEACRVRMSSEGFFCSRKWPGLMYDFLRGYQKNHFNMADFIGGIIVLLP